MRDVNGAYVYRRYIQSEVTVSFSCAGLYNSPFSFSHVRKCFVLCVSSTRSSLRPHIVSIQINDRNVYSSYVFSYVHVIVALWYFHFYQKQETGPTQVRYSIIHQIFACFSLRIWTSDYLELTFKEAIPEKYSKLSGSIVRWTFIVHLKQWVSFLRCDLRLTIYQNVRRMSYMWIQTTIIWSRTEWI